MVNGTYITFMLSAAAVLLLANIIWVYKDANQRGYSGWLIALLVIWAPFPIGVVLWLLMRPKLTDEHSPIESESDSFCEVETGEDIDADLKRRANAGLL